MAIPPGSLHVTVGPSGFEEGSRPGTGYGAKDGEDAGLRISVGPTIEAQLRDYMAPNARLYVEGLDVTAEITPYVQGLTWDHATGMASMLEIKLENRGNRWTDSTLWNPGNALDLWLGYGQGIRYMGRAEIVRHLPNFPASGVPVLTIKAYDRGYAMMEAEEEVSVKGGKKKGKGSAGTYWRGDLEGVLSSILRRYEIELDIHPTVAKYEVAFLQKKGTTDWQVVQALAFLYECDFMVEYVPPGAPGGTGGDAQDEGWYGPMDAPPKSKLTGWVGRFRPPKSPATQPKTYTFRYGDGNNSSLDHVDLDWGMPAGATEVQVWAYDVGTNEWIKCSAEGSKEGNVKEFSKGTFSQGGALGEGVATEGTEADEIGGMTVTKIAANGSSAKVAFKHVSSPAHAIQLAKAWLRQHRDSFVIAKGGLIGVEDLRGGQVHTLDGLGKRYSGDYFFTSAKHVYFPGYRTEFTAHKLITE